MKPGASGTLILDVLNAIIAVKLALYMLPLHHAVVVIQDLHWHQENAYALT